MADETIGPSWRISLIPARLLIHFEQSQCSLNRTGRRAVLAPPLVICGAVGGGSSMKLLRKGTTHVDIQEHQDPADFGSRRR
jgi:hypothetical protein